MRVKYTIEQHTKDIKIITEEMNKLKEIVSLMKNQIIVLNNEIESSKQINVSEIVELVVSLLDTPKTSAMSSTTENIVIYVTLIVKIRR